jgi:hypothetical protein
LGGHFVVKKATSENDLINNLKINHAKITYSANHISLFARIEGIEL